MKEKFKMQATLFKVVKTINEKHHPVISIDGPSELTCFNVTNKPFNEDSFEFFEAVDVFEDVPSAIGLRLINSNGTMAFEFKMPYDELRLEVVKRKMFECCSTFEMTVLLGHNELDWLTIKIDNQAVPLPSLKKLLINHGPKDSTDPIHWSSSFRMPDGSTVEDCLLNVKTIKVDAYDIYLYTTCIKHLGENIVLGTNLLVASDKIKDMFSVSILSGFNNAKRLMKILENKLPENVVVVRLSDLIGYNTETTLLFDPRKFIQGIKFSNRPNIGKSSSFGCPFMAGNDFVSSKLIERLEETNSLGNPESKKDFTLTNKAGEITLTTPSGESLLIHRLESLFNNDAVGSSFLARCINSTTPTMECSNHVIEMNHEEISSLRRIFTKQNFSKVKVEKGEIVEVDDLLQCYLKQLKENRNVNFSVVKNNFMVKELENNAGNRTNVVALHEIDNINFNLIYVIEDKEVFIGVNFRRSIGGYDRNHLRYTQFNCVLRVDVNDLPIPHINGFYECGKFLDTKLSSGDSDVTFVKSRYDNGRNVKTLTIVGHELISLTDNEGFNLVDWYLNKIRENWENRKGNKG